MIIVRGTRAGARGPRVRVPRAGARSQHSTAAAGCCVLGILQPGLPHSVFSPQRVVRRRSDICVSRVPASLTLSGGGGDHCWLRWNAQQRARARRVRLPPSCVARRHRPPARRGPEQQQARPPSSVEGAPPGAQASQIGARATGHRHRQWVLRK